MSKQITRNLPRSAWKNVVIEETGEPLVEVKPNTTLVLGNFNKGYEPFYFVRRTIASMLDDASNALPEGLQLVLVEGYRTIEAQQKLWDKKIAGLREREPHLSQDQIEEQVRLTVAKPNPLANHHCGGAVDVILQSLDGTKVDMGSTYPAQSYSLDERKAFPMLSDQVTPTHAANRTILRRAMEQVGFIWYPGEWWHFCYGDRMWAVYSRQPTCIYGPVELP